MNKLRTPEQPESSQQPSEAAPESVFKNVKDPVVRAELDKAYEAILSILAEGLPAVELYGPRAILVQYGYQKLPAEVKVVMDESRDILAGTEGNGNGVSRPFPQVDKKHRRTGVGPSGRERHFAQ